MIYKNDKGIAYQLMVVSFICYSLVSFYLWRLYPDVPVTALYLSVLHILMLHALVWQFVKIICVDTKRVLSPVSMYFVTTLFYFAITFSKYFRDPNYVEFTNDLYLRAGGTFLVFLSMFGILLWWSWWLSSHPDRVQPILQKLGEVPRFQKLAIALLIFSLSVGYLNLILFSNGGIGMNISSRYKSIFLIVTGGLCMPLYVYAMFIKKRVVRNIILVGMIISAVSSTFMTMSRSILMLTVITVILFNLYKLNEKSKIMNRAIVFTLFLPLLVLILAVPLTGYIRGGIRTDIIETANRAELSDYAFNISLVGNQPGPYNILKNAFLWALPGSVVDKTRLEYAEVDFQYENGWRISDYRNGYTLDTIDYSDTVFSVGAFIGGYVGMVLFPLFWIWMFTWFINKCSGLLHVAAYLIGVSQISHIELSAWAVVSVVRNYILFVIILYFLMKLMWLSDVARLEEASLKNGTTKKI